MKNKVLFVLNCIWSSVIAFTFPFCLGVIFMNITGHSKGYAYDLGAEIDISIMMGAFELFIWLVLALPSNISVIKKLLLKNKYLIVVYLLIFVLLSMFCISLLGGWNKYIRDFYGIGM